MRTVNMTLLAVAAARLALVPVILFASLRLLWLILLLLFPFGLLFKL